jgi:hypothetical protein
MREAMILGLGMKVEAIGELGLGVLFSFFAFKYFRSN